MPNNKFVGVLSPRHEPNNPCRGIQFTRMSGPYAAYANRNFVGHYTSLGEALKARNVAEQEEANGYYS